MYIASIEYSARYNMNEQSPTNTMTFSSLDRLLIGGLVSALSVILWWMLLDLRSDLRNLTTTVSTNGNRITTVESRLSAIEAAHIELKLDLKEHRAFTENGKK